MLSGDLVGHDAPPVRTRTDGSFDAVTRRWSFTNVRDQGGQLLRVAFREREAATKGVEDTATPPCMVSRGSPPRASAIVWPASGSTWARAGWVAERWAQYDVLGFTATSAFGGCVATASTIDRSDSNNNRRGAAPASRYGIGPRLIGPVFVVRQTCLTRNLEDQAFHASGGRDLVTANCFPRRDGRGADLHQARRRVGVMCS